MKHNWPVTLIILFVFMAAQLVGLGIIGAYLDKDLPFGMERPEFNKDTSYVPLFSLIVIVTIIILLFRNLRMEILWKLWFLFAVVIALAISFSLFVPQNVAIFLALILGLMKLLHNNVIVHNFTELFIYGGIAAIFVPVISFKAMIILLVLISLYDMYAVWKSKHMIKLAKFQAKLKIFAGILVPYGKKAAFLGGGDVGFTLLFAGVVMKTLGPLEALFVVGGASIALLLLFYYSEKSKFYPAMPFLTIGCFIGYILAVIV